MEVPMLGIISERQLLAYTTADVTQDLSHVCNLHHSSWQCQILNPLGEARDRTCILMDTSQVCYRWDTTRTLLANIWVVYLKLSGVPCFYKVRQNGGRSGTHTVTAEAWGNHL